LKFLSDELAETSARQRIVPDHEVYRRTKDGSAAGADKDSNAPTIASFS
jgi:hypothetical protein